MNIKKTVAAILLATAAGASFADGATVSAPTGKTRAEVIAELKQAERQGLIATNDADFSDAKSTVSGQASNQTLAQLKNAHKTNN